MILSEAVPILTGTGAAMRDGEIPCEKHDATSDGECTHGPCEGATLDEVDVVVEDGGVDLADDRFEFEKVGPSADVDPRPALGSTSPGTRGPGTCRDA